MNRASPKDLRAAMEIAQTMVKAGVLFFPMPALDQADYHAMANQAGKRLERLAEAVEQEAP